MTINSALKSRLRFWAYLAIALGFLSAGPASSSIVFTLRPSLEICIHAVLFMFSSFALVAIARLLSLAPDGQLHSPKDEI